MALGNLDIFTTFQHFFGPVAGNIRFPLTALICEIITNGSYPETFRPVNEKKTANWQPLLEATQTHGTGFSRTFLIGGKQEHFSRLIRVSNRVQLATPGSYQVFNHTTREHQSNTEQHPGDCASWDAGALLGYLACFHL